mgnify:CR=1 FL=1
MQIFCILCANLRKIAIIFVDIENLHYLCEKIAGNLKYQITMEENNKWKSLRKTLISKYAIAIYVFAVIMIFMLFAAGLKKRYFAIFGGSLIAAAPLIYFLVLSPEQQARIQNMFNLEADLQGGGWQQWRGRIALANGGLWGQGLFKGELTQTGAVPESFNDFIFVSIGEELGLVGCTLVLILLGAICLRVLRIGSLVREKSGKLICVGVFSMLFAQIVVNLGMCLSITPVIGVTLPFFSAGGTSLLCLFCSIGVVMSVYMHRNSKLMRIYD